MSNTEANVPSTLADDSTAEVGSEDFNYDDPIGLDVPLPDSLLKSTGFLKDEEKAAALPQIDEVPDLADDDEDEDLSEAANAQTEEVDEVNNSTADEEVDDAEASTDLVQMTEDEVDWDAMIPDANGEMRSLADMRKGFSIDQHLTAKGRELGEARRAFDYETAQKTQQLNTMAATAAGILYNDEQRLAEKFHKMDTKIKEAVDDDDDYTADELKGEKVELQKKYWNARNNRESIEHQAVAQQEAHHTQRWQEDIHHFQQNVTRSIPDFDEGVAESIRAFALNEGLPETLINSVTDIALVKFVDDYRRLKNGVKKGGTKRAKAPVRKAPVKRNKSQDVKAKEKTTMVKQRAFREDASSADQLAYMKTLASKSLRK